MNEHDAIARIKRLSHSINCADEIAEVIERLIKERDEARRLYLASPFSEDEIIHEMKRHGWDCFNKESN